MPAITIMAMTCSSSNTVIREGSNAPADWMGVSVHSLTSVESNLVRGAGVGWVRADVGEIPGEYSFEQIAVKAKDLGLKVLGILDIWTMKWNWNFTTDEWAEAVRYAATRYQRNVDAWEIWNEPESPLQPMDAQIYFNLLRVAYPILKESCPHAPVLMGGGLQLNSGDDPWLSRDEAFAKEIFELGAEDYADGISFHAYPWTQELADWVWANYSASLAFYQLLAKKPLEIWITETGRPAEFEGEKDQANYLADTILFFRNRKVSRIFWYELRDTPEWTAENPTFGLLTENLTPRASYFALQRILLGTSTQATQMSITTTGTVPLLQFRICVICGDTGVPFDEIRIATSWGFKKNATSGPSGCLTIDATSPTVGTYNMAFVHTGDSIDGNAGPYKPSSATMIVTFPGATVTALSYRSVARVGTAFEQQTGRKSLLIIWILVVLEAAAAGFLAIHARRMHATYRRAT
jgi:hypothetical protein